MMEVNRMDLDHAKQNYEDAKSQINFIQGKITMLAELMKDN